MALAISFKGGIFFTIFTGKMHHMFKVRREHFFYLDSIYCLATSGQNAKTQNGYYFLTLGLSTLRIQ